MVLVDEINKLVHLDPELGRMMSAEPSILVAPFRKTALTFLAFSLFCKFAGAKEVAASRICTLVLNIVNKFPSELNEFQGIEMMISQYDGDQQQPMRIVRASFRNTFLKKMQQSDNKQFDLSVKAPDVDVTWY